MCQFGWLEITHNAFLYNEQLVWVAHNVNKGQCQILYQLGWIPDPIQFLVK